MRAFTDLYFRLDAASATGEKLAALHHYFRTAPPEDAAWALWLLTGSRLKRTIPRSLLRDLAGELAAVPPWLVEESYHAVGDLSETLALLIPLEIPGFSGSCSPPEPPGLAAFFAQRIEPLRRASPARQRELILGSWAMLPTAPQRLVFHKLLSGAFRVGVSRGLTVRALAHVAGITTAEMEARLTGDWAPSGDFLRLLLQKTPLSSSAAGAPSAADAATTALRPLPFYLAHQLDGDPAEIEHALGPRELYHAEWKFDGIRGQLITRHAIRPHGAALWSRGQENISAQFPDLIAAAAAELPDDTILDGEILAFEHASNSTPPPAPTPNHLGLPGTPLPFADLQLRLGKKLLQPVLFADVPVAFVAYDLLHSRGADLRNLPTAQRRKMLEQLLGAQSTSRQILLSPLLPQTTWADLAAARAQSRSLGVEGLMLKHHSAPYGVGRTKSAAATPQTPAAPPPAAPPAAETDGPSIPSQPPPVTPDHTPHHTPGHTPDPDPDPDLDQTTDPLHADDDSPAPLPIRHLTIRTGWFKWKVDPFRIDAILLYAQPGRGRRATLFTDYTFALWKHPPAPASSSTSSTTTSSPAPLPELITIAKAYSGLTDAEIDEVNRFIRANTTARSRGGFVSVRPQLVFELAFEAIAQSSRHKSGLALRFPRIARWRRDKSPLQADCLATLRAMHHPP